MFAEIVLFVCLFCFWFICLLVVVFCFCFVWVVGYVGGEICSGGVMAYAGFFGERGCPNFEGRMMSR